MIKILFMYHVSTIGGGSYCLLNILKGLDRTQIQPIVVLRGDGPLVSEIESLGIEVHFLPNMRTVPYNSSMLSISKLKNGLSMMSSFKYFRNLIRKLNPDVVYLNTMMLYPYLKPAKDLEIKTLIHIREHWPEGEHKCQRHWALNHIAKFADEIVAINRYSASMIVPYNRKATIVYDWIDLTNRYKEISLDSIFGEDMTGKKTFLYLGGMQPIKGVKEVLLAFTKYLKNDDYRLLLLGVDLNHKAKDIRSFVKKILSRIGYKSYSESVMKLALSDKRVKCIKSLYEIRHLYEQAYCVLSYFTIPHANLSLAESIICNTLNVAALTDESLEYSLEGDLAILYEENNFDDFVAKLMSLESCRDSMLLRIKNKSHKVEIMFDPLQNIEALNKIFKNI